MTTKSKRTETLTDWELVAITEAVEAYRKNLDTYYGHRLLKKLQATDKIRVHFTRI